VSEAERSEAIQKPGAVIASEAKQSRGAAEGMPDCFVAHAPRNDEARPRACRIASSLTLLAMTGRRPLSSALRLRDQRLDGG
jgi:hypothetical protein